MRGRSLKTYLLTAAPLAMLATTAHAAAPEPKFGDPVTVTSGVTIDPMLDARLRWEDVDATTKSADAVTLRVRGGVEVKEATTHLSFLVEVEGNVAMDKHYGAFPYANPGANQYRPTLATIADAENTALNRLQIAYQTKTLGLTVGRQRINLDDQRFVGASGWRQNEQTFDAVRGTVNKGVVVLDATYAQSQRTIYGTNGGLRTGYAGQFAFLNGGLKGRLGSLKGFAYLLDYDKTAFSNAAARSQLDSSQTYGFRAVSAPVKLAKGVSAMVSGSYAEQSAYGNNAKRFSAEYYTFEGTLNVHNQALTGGYEQLGSDRGAQGGAWSFQTPMATLHKFNGTADMFLTTPANGLADTYVGLAGKLPEVKCIPGLSYGVTYHWFGSAIQNQKYGNEVDAQVGFRIARVNWLVKYANYDAQGFGVNTQKFWLQAEYGF